MLEDCLKGYNVALMMMRIGETIRGCCCFNGYRVFHELYYRDLRYTQFIVLSVF